MRPMGAWGRRARSGLRPGLRPHGLPPGCFRIALTAPRVHRPFSQTSPRGATPARALGTHVSRARSKGKMPRALHAPPKTLPDPAPEGAPGHVRGEEAALSWRSRLPVSLHPVLSLRWGANPSPNVCALLGGSSQMHLKGLCEVGLYNPRPVLRQESLTPAPTSARPPPAPGTAGSRAAHTSRLGYRRLPAGGSLRTRESSLPVHVCAPQHGSGALPTHTNPEPRGASRWGFSGTVRGTAHLRGPAQLGASHQALLAMNCEVRKRIKQDVARGRKCKILSKTRFHFSLLPFI